MRRRKNGIPPELFRTSELPNLEDRMIGLIRKPDLTVTKVMEWLLPDVILRKLRDAKPFVEQSSFNKVFDTDFVLGEPYHVHLSVAISDQDFLCPADGCEMPQPDRDSGIVAYIQDVYAVRVQWQKVRDVVEWMNDPEHHMTYSAARAFWPSILSLVSSEHPIHSVDGQRYRDPQGIGAIIPLMRETSEIVATALLMPVPDLPNLAPVKFNFKCMPREHGLV